MTTAIPTVIINTRIYYYVQEDCSLFFFLGSKRFVL